MEKENIKDLLKELVEMHTILTMCEDLKLKKFIVENSDKIFPIELTLDEQAEIDKRIHKSFDKITKLMDIIEKS